MVVAAALHLCFVLYGLCFGILLEWWQMLEKLDFHRNWQFCWIWHKVSFLGLLHELCNLVKTGLEWLEMQLFGHTCVHL